MNRLLFRRGLVFQMSSECCTAYRGQTDVLVINGGPAICKRPISVHQIGWHSVIFGSHFGLLIPHQQPSATFLSLPPSLCFFVDVGCGWAVPHSPVMEEVAILPCTCTHDALRTCVSCDAKRAPNVGDASLNGVNSSWHCSGELLRSGIINQSQIQT